PITNKITLGKELGSGGHGQVYQGQHAKKGKVAVKVVSLEDEEDQDWVREELYFLSKYSAHRNVATYHGAYFQPKASEEEPDKLWIMMKLCGGGSIGDLVNSMNGSPLSEKWIAYFCRETLHGLKHLHKHRVAHRDIKCLNIMLTEEAKVKIIDFGISGMLDKETGMCYEDLGTPDWKAPEISTSQQGYDVKCDIWSLGVTAYEMAEGQPPFVDIDPEDIVDHILQNPTPKLPSNKWSEKFQSFLELCLEKNVNSRPTAKQLLKHPFVKDLPPDKQIRGEIKDHLKALKARRSIKESCPHKRNLTPCLKIVSDEEEDEEEEKESKTPQERSPTIPLRNRCTPFREKVNPLTIKYSSEEESEEEETSRASQELQKTSQCKRQSTPYKGKRNPLKIQYSSSEEENTEEPTKDLEDNECEELSNESDEVNSVQDDDSCDQAPEMKEEASVGDGSYNTEPGTGNEADEKEGSCDQASQINEETSNADGSLNHEPENDIEEIDGPFQQTAEKEEPLNPNPGVEEASVGDGSCNTEPSTGNEAEEKEGLCDQASQINEETSNADGSLNPEPENYIEEIDGPFQQTAEEEEPLNPNPGVEEASVGDGSCNTEPGTGNEAEEKEGSYDQGSQINEETSNDDGSLNPEPENDIEEIDGPFQQTAEEEELLNPNPGVKEASEIDGPFQQIAEEEEPLNSNPGVEEASVGDGSCNTEPGTGNEADEKEGSCDQASEINEETSNADGSLNPELENDIEEIDGPFQQTADEEERLNPNSGGEEVTSQELIHT
ncbi:hypothetical protein XELAEV_18010701mg, partial [Xenopus laevis]